MPRFRLKPGMYLVITKVLENETPSLVGWSWKYEDCWQFWLDHDDREWELARAVGTESNITVYRMKPIPPSRLARRLGLNA